MEEATGRALAPLAGHAKTVRGVAFSPDSTTLASAGEDGEIRLWDPVTGQPRRRIDDTDEVNCLAFAPDGRTLASTSDDGVIKLWPATEGGENAPTAR